MNRAEFATEVSRIQDPQTAAHENGAGALLVGILLVDLLVTRTLWAKAAVVDIFSGAHGMSMVDFARQAAHQGCSTYASRELRRVVCAPMPFAYWCGAYGRVDVLASVARLAIDFDSGLLGRGAVSAGGGRLDRMSSLWSRPSATGKMAQSFVDMVYEQRSEWGRKTVRECAQLLAELDPQHRGIAKYAGTEFGSLITEALMQVRIRESATAPVEQPRRRPMGI
jgi:hypothetical protein